MKRTYAKLKDGKQTQVYGDEKLDTSTDVLTLHNVTDVNITEGVCNEYNKQLIVTAKNRDGQLISFKLFLEHARSK